MPGVRAEKEKSQNIIQVLATITFMAVLAFPAFDNRFSWSAVPPYVAVGELIVFLVYRGSDHSRGGAEGNIHGAVRAGAPSHVCESAGDAVGRGGDYSG